MASFKHIVLPALIVSSLLFASSANADTNISYFNSTSHASAMSMDKITQLVRTHFDIQQYRNIKLQVVSTNTHASQSVLVYLFSKTSHSVKLAKMTVDANFQNVSIINNYHLTAEDTAAQPGISVMKAHCPDPAVQFIAFAPNDMALEQEKTIEVAKAAEAHGLKTVRLLLKDATRTNYINYMSCPLLEGNFYDGDANPELITTVDGELESMIIARLLRNQFKFKATNIWLACEAFNDPMKTTMIDTAQSQKFAAGINDLIIGPSDNAAACAMEAALDGKPMTVAFNTCYDQLDKDHNDPDDPDHIDQWGFDGKGSDYFGT